VGKKDGLNGKKIGRGKDVKSGELRTTGSNSVQFTPPVYDPREREERNWRQTEWILGGGSCQVFVDKWRPNELGTGNAGGGLGRRQMRGGKKVGEKKIQRVKKDGSAVG